MSNPVVIEGLDISKAPFDDILAIRGIGPAKMDMLMEQVGRLAEYEEWQKPLMVDDMEITRSELKSYGNLSAVHKLFGFDPQDLKYGGITQKERTAAAKKDFERARSAGKVTDMDLARVIADMKKRRAIRDEEEAAREFENVAGMRPENLEAIQRLIQARYEELLRDYNAPTTDAAQQLLHVANLLVNRQMMQDTYSEINVRSRTTDEIVKNVKALGEINNQITRMTNEVEGILKQFKKRDDQVGGPAQIMKQTVEKTKEIREVFGLPVECPVCHTRFGYQVKFFPGDYVAWPVIDHDCPVVHPDGKKCSGHIHVDIDEHLDNNGVVMFTSQEHFKPNEIAKRLLEVE